jgi:hypothetical protein
MARTQSAIVHTAIAQQRSVFDQKSTPVSDGTGKPPAEAHQRRGCLSRKLMVARNSITAITLPISDSFGDNGLMRPSVCVSAVT